jgi:CRP-like cAMP-binding protein
VSGTVLLEELGVRIGAGELLGEIAFFSPAKRRTATAVCATGVVLACIGQRDMVELYQQDPAFRLYVVQVFAKRLIQDLERLASRAR